MWIVRILDNPGTDKSWLEGLLRLFLMSRKCIFYLLPCDSVAKKRVGNDSSAEAGLAEASDL